MAYEDVFWRVLQKINTYDQSLLINILKCRLSRQFLENNCSSSFNMWSFFSRDAAKDFPYEILEQVNGTEEFLFWKLHKGKKKVCQLIYTAKKKVDSLFLF